MSAHASKFGLAPNYKAKKHLAALERRVTILRLRLETQEPTGAHAWFAGELAALDWVFRAFEDSIAEVDL